MPALPKLRFKPKLPPVSLAFYQRLNPRERVLTLLVAGAVFVLANLLALNFLIGSFRNLNEQYADGALTLRRERFWADSQPTWQERMKWLKDKQPPITNRAPTQLLEQVQGAARVSQVLIRNQQPRALGTNLGGSKVAGDYYQPASVHFETESDWKQLVDPKTGFLTQLQKPENFIVFEQASLHTDPADAKRMRCSFDIAKWHASGGK